jgi:hypothetical protein
MRVLEANMRRVLVSAVLALGCVSPAWAQDLASSFDQLRVLVKAGDTLTITDSGGQETRGRLVRLVGTSLEMDVDGTPQMWSQDRVTTIRQRHRDSLANGAKIGFGVGVGFGLLMGIAFSSEGEDWGAIPAFALINGAMYAGIGVGVDALISGNRVVFSRPSSPSARLSAAPIVGPGRRGVRLTVGW